MLRFVAVLLFVGLAVAEVEEFKWDSVPVIANASQCIYRPELKILSCRGPSGIVECPTIFESSRLGSLKFPVFGIRRDVELSERTPIEDSVFELFPRKIDNTTYMNSTIVVEGKPVEILLYWNEKAIHAGYRVTEVKCYRRLIENVFVPSTLRQLVKLENGEEVHLFGEVLFADKPQHKRWLGFGFPFFGAGLFGWGLGWGLPFWG